MWELIIGPSAQPVRWLLVHSAVRAPERKNAQEEL